MTHRYTLHTYVCGPYCTQEVPHEGVLTYAQILTERPQGCRYAVVSDHANTVQVWDLYEQNPSKEPLVVFEWVDVDAAVMATMMRYDHD